MRKGIKEIVNLEGKINEITTYDTENLSAYKLAGFFRELFEKVNNKIDKEKTYLQVNSDINENYESFEVRFSPEDEWENSAKGRDDYYGTMALVVFDENKIEKMKIEIEDLYNTKEIEADELASFEKECKIKSVKLIESSDCSIILEMS